MTALLLLLIAVRQLLVLLLPVIQLAFHADANAVVHTRGHML